MARGTRVACNRKLDGQPAHVRVGGKTVEVYCDDCAKKLKELGASARARRR